MMGRFALGAAFGVACACAAVAMARRTRRRKRVFVSGCYDLLHSGHVAFFKEAAALGEVHVSVGNDANVTAPMSPGRASPLPAQRSTLTQPSSLERQRLCTELSRLPRACYRARKTTLTQPTAPHWNLRRSLSAAQPSPLDLDCPA